MADTGVNPKLPTWDGDWRTFSDYRLACQLEKDGLKDDEQITLAPKLARNLTGRSYQAAQRGRPGLLAGVPEGEAGTAKGGRTG